MSNVLNNAMRYSPRGSRIEVRASRHDGTARVEVVDQGPGVPPDRRVSLFTRYYQSGTDTTGNLQSEEQRQPRAKRGLGLGLYISSEIIRAHGGRIGVDPNPEGGSIFWFELPAVVGDDGR
jgi:signal transduction histidine kinase